MEEQKAYICKKDFPNLGLEAGDYFPSYKFTQEAIDKALKEGKIEEELPDDYFVTPQNTKKVYMVNIQITQRLDMQLRAESISDALEKAKKLTDNGTYAVLNDNCYESDISINSAKPVDNELEIDRLVVEDNEDYLNDLKN